MKLSYNWLNDFVELEDNELNDIVEKLTMGAFEVEEAVPTRLALGNDIVLGEIKEINKHPNADKLQVTKTCIGTKDGAEIIEQIVCGASNIKVGQKIPVATIGSTVTNRHDGSQLKIKKSKIRGVESHGMLASPDELGFDEGAVKSIQAKQGDGIYILYDPSNPVIKDQTQGFKLGDPISQVLKLEPDWVLEVGARSNRGDALSVIGQAREIAALTDKKLKTKKLDFKTLQKNFNYDENIKSVKPKIAKDSLDSDCELFYTINIENVEIRESPQWLQDRINAMGTKAINNVVDISNYVLLELGQPMHFYDREKVNGDLVVRRAKKGEKITTLEEKTVELDDSNLVIADNDGPSSLAGVMGGMDSSINDDTQNIVIEVAVFNPASVRKSARSAGVESESKRRFERGVDKASSKVALLRAIELLTELASPEDGQLSVGAIHTAGSEDVKEVKVPCRTSEVKRILGIDISNKEAIKLLSKLGITSSKENKESIEFLIPSFRQNDITREIDLIEEIGRIYGYNNIPSACPSSGTSTLKDLGNRDKILEKIRLAFTAAGFSEATISSLIGDSLVGLDELSSEILNGDKPIAIEMDNPLSREHRVLRQSMLPGLIQAASRNYAYDKSVDIRLFEIGKVYHYNGNPAKANLDNTVETPKLAAIFVSTESDWTQSKPKTLAENFFQFKSIIENLYPRAKFSTLDASDNPLVHPGISAITSQDNRNIGLIAKLHPSITKEWDLPDETYVLELDHPKIKEPKFKAIASTPIIERDITVDGPDDLDVQAIQDLLLKHSSQDLKNIKLISLYRRNLGKDETGEISKSSTFRLKWQSPTETLSGEAIDAEIEKLKGILEQELKVSFRA